MVAFRVVDEVPLRELPIDKTSYRCNSHNREYWNINDFFMKYKTKKEVGQGAYPVHTSHHLCF